MEEREGARDEGGGSEGAWGETVMCYSSQCCMCPLSFVLPF